MPAKLIEDTEDAWVIPKETVVGEYTVAQELIQRLCAWKGIRTHGDAKIFAQSFGRPDWQEIVDHCIDAMAPVHYAWDDSPNFQRPEWDHLRETPWDESRNRNNAAAEETT